MIYAFKTYQGDTKLTKNHEEIVCDYLHIIPACLSIVNFTPKIKNHKS